MVETPEEARIPASLRVLKALVMVLLASMIGGVITVVWLLVTRLPHVGGEARLLSELPTDIVLPPGETLQAITFTRSFLLIVTQSGKILVEDAPGQPLRQIAAIEAPAP